MVIFDKLYSQSGCPFELLTRIPKISHHERFRDILLSQTDKIKDEVEKYIFSGQKVFNIIQMQLTVFMSV